MSTAAPAVAGMQQPALRPAGDREHRIGVRIGSAPGAGQGVRLVGQADVERPRVVLGVHRDGTQTGLGGRTQNPYGDLSTVGDEHGS